MRWLPALAALCLATGAGAEVTTSHGVSAFGDLKYPADFAHFEHVNPEAPKGGALRTTSTFAMNNFDSLNPFILKGDAPPEITLYTFDTLMTSGADEADAVYGLLAKSVSWPEDRSWAEFRLREEARFDGGAPVTADDVVFSFEILRDEGSPTWRIHLRPIERVEALAPDLVRFTFRDGAATRDLPMLAGGIPILSRASWEGRDFAASTLEPVTGSGPYRVGEAEPGRSISFIRRDDYWARDLPVNRGRWNFDEISLEYFRDRTAAFEAFKAGGYDLHEEFYSKLWATAYDFPAIRSGEVVREAIPDLRPSGTQGYWFNLRRPVFADIRVREAIASVFDFEWSNKTLFYGLYNRTVSFVQGSPLAASGMASEAEKALLEPLMADLPETVLTEPAFVPNETDGSGRLRRELQAAAKLLDEAGWKPGPDGVRRNAKGETLSIEFLDDSPVFERITQPFIRNLERIGVDARMRTIDAAQMQARMKDYDFDITPARPPIAQTPGVELRTLFGSEAAKAPDTLNLSGIANPAIDALIEAVVGAKSAEEHKTAVSALDRALRSLHIWTPHWNKASHSIAWWDKFGRPETKPPYDRAIVDRWWSRGAE